MTDGSNAGPNLAGDSLQIWRTVVLGRCSVPVDYLTGIKNKVFKIGRVASIVTRTMPADLVSGVAKLVKVTGPDLGLPVSAPLQAFYDNFRKFGLKLCRRDVALALREDYTDQPMNEILWVVSEPLFHSKESGVLCVGHNECGKWIYFGCGGGCPWGRWRLANFSPEIQNIIVPRWLCECPWSLAPITAIFEI